MKLNKFTRILAVTLTMSMFLGQSVSATEIQSGAGGNVSAESSVSDSTQGDGAENSKENEAVTESDSSSDNTSDGVSNTEVGNDNVSGAESSGDKTGVDSKGTTDKNKTDSEADAQSENDSDAKAVSEEEELATASNSLSGAYKLQYRVHRQTYGWSDWIDSDNVAGTIGEAKRLEAIQIRIVDKNGNATSQYHVYYKVHRQTYGWTDWVSDGAEAGTTGQSKRLEAICIKVVDNSGNTYKVTYRVHAQTYGWMDTVTGDALAGTTGVAKRLEAIVISLNDTIPTPSSNSTAPQAKTTKASITYSGHVQTYGDVAAVENGAQLGTTGLGKRIEGITINLIQPTSGNISGNIVYSAHVQTYGWLNSVTNGTYCGTTGQSKRMEAIKISLTGDLAKQYDIYYRVHVQTHGWLGWAMNGDAAGTEGYAKRLEAIEIRLVKKGEAAPSISGNAFLKKSTDDEGKVAAIKKYLGVNYVWGGNSPTTGWDCSGCCIWLLKNLFGVTLKGRASYQIVYEGTAISTTDRNQWKVGDLLFFGDSVANNEHVAMYIGNGEMFHAASTNLGTIVSKVDNWTSWGQKLVAVRRYK